MKLKNSSKLGGSLLIVLLAFTIQQLTFLPTVIAQQSDTTVNATLFSTTAEPTLNITSPPPSSVVSSTTITVSGTTINATTVRVYVNGTLVATLDSSLGSFSVDVSLAQGNNIIRIVAHSTYSGLETEETRIVTYEPDVVDPTDPTDPTDPETNLPGEQTPKPIIPGTPNTGFFNNLKNNLSFDADRSFVYPAGNWLLVLVALLLFIFSIYPKAYQLIPVSFKKRPMLVKTKMRIFAAIVAIALIYLAHF